MMLLCNHSFWRHDMEPIAPITVNAQGISVDYGSQGGSIVTALPTPAKLLFNSPSNKGDFVLDPTRVPSVRGMLEVWVKLTAAGAAATAAVLHDGTNRISIGITAGGLIDVRVYSASGVAVLSASSTSIPVGVLTRLRLIWDSAGTASFYVGDVATVPVVAAWIAFVPTRLRIGGGLTGLDWNGSIHRTFLTG